MSQGLYPTISEPEVTPTPRRTSSCTTNNSREENPSTHLLPDSAKSSKKVTICKCGQYKGIRMRRCTCITLFISLALLILLVGALIVLYVVVPQIVRTAISNAQLGFRSVNIDKIQADSFRLQAQLELSHTGSIPATILSPFVIHVDNIGTLTSNEPITISGNSSGSAVVPIEAAFVVSDVEAFHNFSHSLIFERSVVWHLKAEATIRPISRHMISYSKIPFNKNVTLGALNGLPNVKFDTISLNRSDAQRVIADLTITITNPSVFSIELGT
jgi:hypothetical protein